VYSIHSPQKGNPTESALKTNVIDFQWKKILRHKTSPVILRLNPAMILARLIFCVVVLQSEKIPQESRM